MNLNFYASFDKYSITNKIVCQGMFEDFWISVIIQHFSNKFLLSYLHFVKLCYNKKEIFI